MFAVDERTSLDADPGLDAVAQWWRATLGPATGCWFPPRQTADDAPGHTADHTPGHAADHTTIRLELDDTLGREAYRIEITPMLARITGGGAAGVQYGLQTLRQLLPPATYAKARTRSGPWAVPCLAVEDAPRFGWRGVLLDVARHFLPKAEVLRFIDLLALHKLNVLTLHLTDDQGWRFAVPGWPRLTEVGAWRAASPVGHHRHGLSDARPHGGFYQREELAEIVAYAADRGVTVVPEVDLPGHVQAAVAAYPELGNTGRRLEVATTWGISRHVLNLSDRALAFCRDVLDEVCAIFPAEYISIGGDECPLDEWRTGPAAQARIAAAGLAGPEQLQPWFTAQLAAHLRTHGRRLLGWDEILDGGAPAGATVAAWRGPAATVRAVRAGHEVIACPDTAVYLDYRQSTHPDEPVPVGPLLTLEDVYAFNPVPPGLTVAESDRIVGVQACLWSEYIDSVRALDYQAFPRLCALAEVAWSGPGYPESDFAGRLRVHKGRLRAYGVEYRRDTGPQPWQVRPDARGWPR
jgi:hexosaminidase